MNTALIKKIETSDDLHFVTLTTDGDIYAEFDGEQLGFDGQYFGDLVVQSSNTFGSEILFTVQGDLGLKVGDSITDEKGGLPIIGEKRGEAVAYVAPVRQTPSYEEAFIEKNYR